MTKEEIAKKTKLTMKRVNQSFGNLKRKGLRLMEHKTVRYSLR